MTLEHDPSPGSEIVCNLKLISKLQFHVFAYPIFSGVHYPAVASITSRNLGSRDRSVFFSATCAGGPLGTLLTGTVGSYVNGAFGWPAVFYTIGFLALTWAAFLRYHAMALSRR